MPITKKTGNYHIFVPKCKNNTNLKTDLFYFSSHIVKIMLPNLLNLDISASRGARKMFCFIGKFPFCTLHSALQVLAVYSMFWGTVLAVYFSVVCGRINYTDSRVGERVKMSESPTL